MGGGVESVTPMMAAQEFVGVLAESEEHVVAAAVRSRR